MYIVNANYVINRKSEVWSDVSGRWQRYYDEHPLTEHIRLLVKQARKRNKSVTLIEKLASNIKAFYTATESYDESVTTEQDVQLRQSIAQKLIDFFKEFNFEPNFRFCNTLHKAACAKQDKEYVENYFALSGNSMTLSIVEKMKSSEWRDMMAQLSSIASTTTINHRFKLYYGSQGTGKTTQALKETDNCMVCHSAMLPSDLMEDFSFDDGKASFKPSSLWQAMVNGTKIVLDEINLLPFESLRFLQSILDGKKSFIYKGQTINIADGFQIIGTMNLVVNGNIFALPEPLIDRACELKKYVLTSDALAMAF